VLPGASEPRLTERKPVRAFRFGIHNPAFTRREPEHRLSFQL